MSNLIKGEYRALETGELAGHVNLDNDYNSYCFVVTRSYFYTTKTGKEIQVPEGFLSDGATGCKELGCAFVIHDWLYAVQKYSDNSPCTRVEADDIMTEILALEGYNWFSRLFYWVSYLNAFGAFSRAYRASGIRGPQFLPDYLPLLK